MSEWLEVGEVAPDFALKDDQGDTVKLSNYLGKTVVLYFYPKDDTPGCTKQACGFRDTHDQLARHDVVVLGVSADSVDSHSNFREKFKLNFPLLVDEGNKLAIRYGAFREKVLYGKTVMGIQRSTYIIGPDGKVLRLFKRVLPDKQIPQLLKALGLPSPTA